MRVRTDTTPENTTLSTRVDVALAGVRLDAAVLHPDGAGPSDGAHGLIDGVRAALLRSLAPHQHDRPLLAATPAVTADGGQRKPRRGIKPRWPNGQPTDSITAAVTRLRPA